MDMNVFKGSDDYVVTKELMNAVNVSIALQKPLLIKGEPGTGKTMLAESISKALDMDLIIWGIKSTTKAQEGSMRSTRQTWNSRMTCCGNWTRWNFISTKPKKRSRRSTDRS